MSGLLQEDFQDYNVTDALHAVLRYEDVVATGPACRPLDFPAPNVLRSELVDIQARDHRSGTIHNLKRVLIRSTTANGKPSDTAYLFTKNLGKSIYGCVRLCIVLKRINKESLRYNYRKGVKETLDDGYVDQMNENIDWESTDYLATVKISEWKKIHAMRGKHLEDPIKEVSAMQLLGNYHPHVIGALECLQDNECLYLLTPYLGGGDVYSRLLEYAGPRSATVGCGKFGFDEGLSRVWFKQLLQVSLPRINSIAMSAQYYMQKCDEYLSVTELLKCDPYFTIWKHLCLRR
jgi:serine/threonine protein kinase